MGKEGAALGWMLISWCLAACSGGTGGTSASEAHPTGGTSSAGASAQAGMQAAESGGATGDAGAGASSGDGGTSSSGGNDGSSPTRIVVMGLRFDFPGPPALCSDGQCPDEQRCFRITSEFGICAPATIAEATQCSAQSTPDEEQDECGCDGLKCAGGKRCREAETYCSCAPISTNRCVEAPCETADDCGDDICVPSPWIWGPRCITPGCRGDADCSLEPGTHCAAVLSVPPQSGEVTFEGTRCVAD